MSERGPIERARGFIDGDPDPATVAELTKVLARAEQGDASALADLADRFAGPLEFGTAGLRGILGAGENRMNKAVVIRATAGLAAHLLAQHPDAARRGVVIGRDARHGSAEFVDEAARVLAAAGIVAHVFDGIVPTPLVAYAVAELGAVAGIMVTASHNPPAYNGYKVYASNGAQIVPPTDASIAGHIAAMPPANRVPRVSLASARTDGLVRSIDPALIARYFDALAAAPRVAVGREALSIVYTPLHGVGDRFAHAGFAKLGFTQVVSVPEQAAPNGDFPTVKFPNPEEPGAMDLALALAESRGADVVIANDPDADRLAVAARTAEGTLRLLSGNEIGILLGHYLLTESSEPVSDPRERLVITTIVSSPMLGRIAARLGARYEETLTGFKWIENRALEVESETGARLVLGYEEALGYSVGTLARDKDGIGAAMAFADLAATEKSRGSSVIERLGRIYREFGLVVSQQHNVTRAGAEGKARIAREMSRVRAAPPRAIAGIAVRMLRDYQARTATELSTGDVTSLTLPASDVLSFELETGARITMRPSGTEPKIKYYVDWVESLAADESLAAGEARAKENCAALTRAFAAFAESAGA